MIKSEIMRKLDLDPCANANENYEILSKIKNMQILKKCLIKGTQKREMDADRYPIITSKQEKWYVWRLEAKSCHLRYSNYVIKSEIMRKLDLDPCANANENYEILSKIKNMQIPKKSLIKGTQKREMDADRYPIITSKQEKWYVWRLEANNANEYANILYILSVYSPLLHSLYMSFLVFQPVFCLQCYTPYISLPSPHHLFSSHVHTISVYHF